MPEGIMEELSFGAFGASAVSVEKAQYPLTCVQV